MKDKWMNMGYEEEDLKPYVEPVQDWNDIKRIEILQVTIHLIKKWTKQEIIENVTNGCSLYTSIIICMIVYCSVVDSDTPIPNFLPFRIQD